MTRFIKKNSHSKGMAPGSLVFVGTQKLEHARIRLIDYNDEKIKEIELDNAADLKSFHKTDSVTWINIDGLHDADLIEKTGKSYNLHPLLLEDIMNTGDRPKIEEYDNCLFILLKMLQYNHTKDIIESEQLGMVLTDSTVLTFQERVGDFFEPVRDRLRFKKGRIRSMGSDYLVYSLFDAVVDNYVHIIEIIGEQIEDVEDVLLNSPTPQILEKINSFKREINFLRKTLRPVRESLIDLIRLETGFIHEQTTRYLNDLYDHIVHSMDALESYRELLADYLSIYHSSIGNKLNDIMKVLTVFSVIFIPLTFLAGIYGTNFDVLPELHFRYAYFIFWGVMLIIAGTMLYYFKKKKWI